MKNKLTTDHLKHYLGTRLNVSYESEDDKLDNQTFQMFGVVESYNPDFSYLTNIHTTQFRLNNSKPYFRRLTDTSLFKEIVVKGYNNGDPFIPIIELAKKYNSNVIKWRVQKNHEEHIKDYCLAHDEENGRFEFYYEDGKFDYWKGIRYCGERDCCNQFQMFEMLLKWHFWIFEQDFFEQGLILEINEL